jgi:hypothetical protein
METHKSLFEGIKKTSLQRHTAVALQPLSGLADPGSLSFRWFFLLYLINLSLFNSPSTTIS